MFARIKRKSDRRARISVPEELQGDLIGMAIYRPEAWVTMDVIPHYWRVQLGADIDEVVERRESTILVTGPVVISPAKNVWALSIPAG